MQPRLKKIDKQKLEAFTIGSMGAKSISRKKLEEQKRREDEEAAANAFKEFVETFQEAPAPASKVWVKAGTYDAGSRKEDTRDRGKLYKPSSKLDQSEKSALERTQEYVKMIASESKKDTALMKKKGQEKKKSNLELFKEELRQMQEEREERHKYKTAAKTMIPSESSSSDAMNSYREEGSFDNGDPNTTNLYLGNLSPKISEQELMKLFGKYGPLASIKIMWPRSEEEKSRGRNCGFVAYMSRRDAERALKNLNGKDCWGYEMKMGWGKAVPVLTHPIYIPPALVQYSMPPPPSGLPFNAQPVNKGQELPKMTSKEYMVDESKRAEMDEILSNSVVKVVIPTERPLLMLIHRTIEFVIREGPMFEAIVMNREIDNPMFRFLFDNESPSHIYYRWKLFSLLQGDNISEWIQREFRMFKGGSVWKPPPMNFYTAGMPEELIADEDLIEYNKGQLSVAQRDRLEDLIRRLTPERQKVADAMIFCIEHADAADEICECIAESLSSVETLPHKKIARIYLVSDILHNCSVKVQNASFFRKAMEQNLMEMFKGLNVSYMGLESRLKAEGFKVRVLQIMRAWEEWAVYPKDFLNKLRSTFLGVPIVEKDTAESEEHEEEDEDLDGVPLDGAALIKGALLRSGVSDTKSQSPTRMDDFDDEIDGIPIYDDDDIDGIPIDEQGERAAFIPSKWETVDPEQVEAQAITTSKWESLPAPGAPSPPKISMRSRSSSSSGTDEDDEDRRMRLREVEVKTMEYQDELESGQIAVKSGWSVGQMVEHYRKKLIKKLAKQQQRPVSSTESPYTTSKRGSSRRSEESPDDRYRSSRNRSRSPHAKRYRSPSPVQSSSRSSRYRSRSPPPRRSEKKHKHKR